MQYDKDGRAVIAAAAGGAAASTLTHTSRAKGPRVWLDMDQQELDDAYDQIVYAPNRDQVGKRRLANSAAALKRLGKPLRFAYGPTPIEGLDVYRSPKPNAPIAIFVHGGAWRRKTSAKFSASRLAYWRRRVASWYWATPMART